MVDDFVACSFARPAGSRTNLVVLYVQEPHHLAGETVLCTIAPSQLWITELEEGDIVYVRNRLRLGDKGDYLGDAVPNARQPLYPQQNQEQSQPISKLTSPSVEELKAAYEAANRSYGLRIDTGLTDPEFISVVTALTDHGCSKKEAGSLLLRYAFAHMPPAVRKLNGSDLYDYLETF